MRLSEGLAALILPEAAIIGEEACAAEPGAAGDRVGQRN